MTDYIPTIGLEIHAELKTRTKMFCNSKNDPDEKSPNVNVCPVCMGHPGTLPVINKEAVKHVLQVGVALGGTLADFTEFDRKNYFYPDIPKGYQISQYAYPLVTGGGLNGVAITRVHLEEDTARSQHTSTGSLVDFNRAGVPLMELVTEPVIHSAKEAGDFARELQLLLRILGVSDADMEKGHMRVEVNVSVGKEGKLGTKTEVKNINSFTFAEKAIDYEIKRQIEALEAGEEVVQETRGWDSVKGVTFSQRKKESSHDYRYFPEPDLPKLKLSEIPEFSREALVTDMPELPWEKRARLKSRGLSDDQADLLVTDFLRGQFFEEATKGTTDVAVVKTIGNYVASVLSFASDKVTPQTLSDLAPLVVEGALSSTGAKSVLTIIEKEGGSPKEIAEREGLLQQSDESALMGIVEQVIGENPSVVEEYKAGKENLLQFFVGQGMKLSKGSANPGVLQKLFKERLA